MSESPDTYSALQHLLATKQSVAAASSLPDCPGVYVLWDGDRVLYVGMSSATIAGRVTKQHLRNRAGSSALRRTLGVHLGLVDRKLSVTRDGRYYPDHVEQQITDYLQRCSISTVPFDDAARLERAAIEWLDPSLNAQR